MTILLVVGGCLFVAFIVGCWCYAIGYDRGSDLGYRLGAAEKENAMLHERYTQLTGRRFVV